VAHSNTPSSGSVSVLIVDDSADTRDMYEYALAYVGFRVLQADNGVDGFSCAAEALPDVIVTDLSIPRIDGFELVARVQRDPRTQRIPVIVLSGCAEADTAQRAIAAGAAAFLLKPCSPEFLIAAVSRAACPSRV
jgi:CheY-like chemotaxis protein